MNGEFLKEASLSRLPGVGAYRPGIVSLEGNSIEVNLGQAPFGHAIPDGYAAWATALPMEDNGRCRSDEVPPAPPAPITGACQPSTFLRDCGGQLVALGIYTADSHGNDHPEGTIAVHVTRRGHVTLGLAAYEPTHWIVDVGAETTVDHVFAYGFYPAHVDVLGATVTISPVRQVGAYQWPFDEEGDDTQGFVSALEHDAAAPLTMFGACYESTDLTVGD